MTIISQEISLSAWSLLLSQRQDLINNYLARVPGTPNQQRTHEMRDEVPSNVGAQDMDRSVYQLSDLDVVEFSWENAQLDADAVFRPGIVTPCHQQHLTTWRWKVPHKTPFCSTKRRTKKTLLQEHQSLRDQQNSLQC